MVTALFVSAVRLPASACPVSSPPIGQACKQGSCPNKACCAEAEKNKARPSSPPLVKGDSTASLLVAVIRPSLTRCLLPVRPAEHSTEPAALGPTASTPPLRGFLCSLLLGSKEPDAGGGPIRRHAWSSTGLL